MLALPRDPDELDRLTLELLRIRRSGSGTSNPPFPGLTTEALKCRRNRGHSSLALIEGCRFIGKRERRISAPPRPIRKPGSPRPHCRRSGSARACIPAILRQAHGSNPTAARWRSGTVDGSVLGSSGFLPCESATNRRHVARNDRGCGSLPLRRLWLPRLARSGRLMNGSAGCCSIRARRRRGRLPG